MRTALFVLIAACSAAAAGACVPEPKPVRGDYEVGVYYFPGWKSAGSWMPLLDFPERKPLLGYYREGDPEIADWQIKWAVEHGITFFAYDWYWVKGGTSLMHGLHDGYMKAKYRKYLKFCLLWANHNPPGTSSEQDLLNVTKFWIENYFKLPEYFRIDGKPVVIIFSPGRLTDDMGRDAVRAAFLKMRELCVQSGVGGLYLIGCASPTRNGLDSAAYVGYNAVTAYNYPGAGLGGRKSAPYEDMVTGFEEIWRNVVKERRLPYLVPLSPGWDSRPWNGPNTLVRAGSTPQKFERMCSAAKSFIESAPAGSVVPRTVIVEAWNEWGEGSYIEPHEQFGFGYLDAIRDVFAGDAPHQDEKPADIARFEVPWLRPPYKTSWEFDSDTEGWERTMNMADVRAEGGSLRARSTTDDCAFWSPPVRIDAGKYGKLAVRMKVDKGGAAQLFWSRQQYRESEERSVSWPLAEDGRFHEYVIDLAANPGWAGEILQLRLDPTTKAGASIEIDYLRITP